jgi:hypothetical protein
MSTASEPIRPTIVTSGVDSEYSLSDLSAFLREQDYEVVELDFGRVRESVKPLLRKLAKRKTIFITSAHTNLSLRLAERIIPGFPKLYPYYLAPVEIIPMLRPKLSMFVPHDLLSPFGDDNLNERSFLDLYDHVFAPRPQSVLEAELGPGTRVHVAGWIKFNTRKIAVSKSLKLHGDKKMHATKTLFISMIQHFLEKYGLDGFADYLGPILEPGMNVKLPAWKGIEHFEAVLVDRYGVNIIPATDNSIELIGRSDVVLCNTISSILVESVLMGIPTVGLLDDEGLSADEKQRKSKDFPEISWHDYRNRSPFPEGYLAELASRPKNPCMKPFDFDAVLSLINEM